MKKNVSKYTEEAVLGKIKFEGWALILNNVYTRYSKKKKWL